MVKRPKLANVGDEGTNPEAEVVTSFVPNEEGGVDHLNPEGNTGEVEADPGEPEPNEQDVKDQEAAGVVTTGHPASPGMRPTAHAQAQNSTNAQSNQQRSVSPKAQFNKLKADVFKLGALHGGGKTSMIALAEAVTEAAQDGAITVEQVPDIYDKFKEGATKGSTYEDAGEVSDEAAMGMAPAKSIEQQLSKLRQFVILGGKYESDALDLIRKARNMHIELLRRANGDAEVKKGIKPGSTYSVLVDVARGQLKKHKEGVEANKKAAVKQSNYLGPLLTDDELRALMTQEVKETAPMTGEEKLLAAYLTALAAEKGGKERNPVPSDELSNAIQWLRQALAVTAPDLLREHDDGLAQAEADKAQREADKVERERLAAEKAAQPKPTKAERQQALATDRLATAAQSPF